MADNPIKYANIDSLSALVSKITEKFAAKSHSHDDRYYTESEINSKVSTLQTALDGKAASGHTHSYAGSSSVGGSATSAVKLDTETAGAATQPVYFNGGKPTACSYTLGKSVPANAVFTDTKTPKFTDDGNGNVTLTIV